MVQLFKFVAHDGGIKDDVLCALDKNGSAECKCC